MKSFFATIGAFALLLSSALYFVWAVSAQQGGSYSNPLQGNISVVDAGTCSTTNSFVWQHLPFNAGTTTVNLSGTFTATVTVRQSNNGGATWTTASSNGTLTTTGTTTYPTNGFTDFCTDVTAFTSGTVVISISTGLHQSIPGSSSLAGTNGQYLFNNNGVFGAGGLTAASGGNAGNIIIGSGKLITADPAGGTNGAFINFGGGSNLTLQTFGGQSIIASNTFQAPTYTSTANCSSSASPAVCAAASEGSVVVAAAATTVQVNTTAVTANSQIQLTFDSSLGTKLTVTCNTTPVQPTVSARTAASNFTITVPTAPTTNPACFSYSIIN